MKIRDSFVAKETALAEQVPFDLCAVHLPSALLPALAKAALLTVWTGAPGQRFASGDLDGAVEHAVAALELDPTNEELRAAAEYVARTAAQATAALAAKDGHVEVGKAAIGREDYLSAVEAFMEAAALDKADEVVAEAVAYSKQALRQQLKWKELSPAEQAALTREKEAMAKRARKKEAIKEREAELRAQWVEQQEVAAEWAAKKAAVRARKVAVVEAKARAERAKAKAAADIAAKHAEAEKRKAVRAAANNRGPRTVHSYAHTV